MKNILFEIPEKEIREMQQQLSENEILKNETLSNSELLLLYKIWSMEKRIIHLEKHLTTPLIHKNNEHI